MTEACAPRSDQINAEDMLTGPTTITITDVKRGSTEQPVDIVTEEFGPGRPYKPSKTMRRILVAAWGVNTANYIGRRITIYRDPEVTFGREKVGGIKISHLSHIEKRLEIALTVTRGRRSVFAVDPLLDAAAIAAQIPRLPLIPQAKVTEFEQGIVAANSLPELDVIVGHLKAYDLGPHRDQLKTLWDERRAEIAMDAARDTESEG